MPILTTIPTTAEDRATQPNWGNYAFRTITQRVSGTGYNPSLTVGATVPAGAQIIRASLKSATTIPIRLGSSAAATAGQAGVGLVWTAPTSIVTSVTTAHLLFLTAQSAFAANIPINSDPNDANFTTAAATNGLILPTTLNLPSNQFVGTAARSFYIVPFCATTAAEAAQRYQVATGTAATVATTGYTLGTSTSDAYAFDVQIVYAILTETPDQ